MGSYVPNTPAQRQEMLAAMGLGTMADLYRDVPESMKIRDGLRLPSGLSEWEVRRKVTALAAEKVTEYDAAALIEDTAAEGSVNVYHWWTAGGEKDAIESVISGFQAAYPSSQAKSNAIPGGAGGAMVMKVKVRSA